MIPNYAFHGLTNLKTLILNNLPYLERIDPLAFHDLRTLDTLQCQKNKKLEYIDPYAFFNNLVETKYGWLLFLRLRTSLLPRPNAIRRVYLGDNGLRFVSEKLLLWREGEQIQLVGNPLECNCDLEWIVEVAREHSGFELSDYLVCHGPEQLRGVPIKDLQPDDFGCKSEWSDLENMARIQFECYPQIMPATAMPPCRY